MRRIAMNVAVLAIVAPLVALVAGAPGRVTVGIALGGLLAAGNLWVIERISARVVRGSVRAQSILMALLVVKMSALMAAVYFLVRTLGVDAIGFVIGLSTFVVGLLAEGLRTALRRGGDPTEAPDGAAERL